jgi:hypothetical protein
MKNAASGMLRSVALIRTSDSRRPDDICALFLRNSGSYKGHPA